MEIRLELNQRFRTGYQVRVIHGPLNKVYDQEPLNMYEAGACAGTFLEMLNKEFGTQYKPHQVLQVTEEAMTVNARAGDFASARMLQDIKSGNYELSVPSGADCVTKEINGEEEVCFTGRGTVLFAYFSWKNDGNERAHDVLLRYCQYISAHGFKGGATEALTELDSLDKDRAVEWIRRTYARHVHDDAALISFAMN